MNWGIYLFIGLFHPWDNIGIVKPGESKPGKQKKTTPLKFNRSPLKFNRSPLKKDSWKTILSFWGKITFQGLLLPKLLGVFFFGGELLGGSSQDL